MAIPSPLGPLEAATLVLLVGGAALVGATIAALAARLRWQRRVSSVAAGNAAEVAGLQAHLEERTRQCAGLAQAFDSRQQRERELIDEIGALRAAEGRLTAALDAERRGAAEKLALLEEAERRMRTAFEGLSAEALRQNAQSFLDLARTSLGDLQRAAAVDLDQRQKAVESVVAPMRDSLQRVDSALHEIEKQRLEAYAGLRQQVTQMAAGQQQLQHETATLVRALRAPAARGRWGELHLRRVVELAGMVDHCDFVEQVTVMAGESRQRPDLVIRLPGGKNVVVDAKAPLAAYLDAVELGDTDAAETQVREHSRQVRDHLTRLGARGYWEQFEPSPEFVVMFLPGEAFLGAALRHDPTLIEYGVERKVIIASPTTLIALLRAVAYGWRQELLAENAQRISDLGRQLYERAAGLADSVGDLGKSLERAVRSYNRAVGSLETRVFVAARRFKELGAGSPRDIPEVETIDRTVRPLRGASAMSDLEEEREERGPERKVG